MEQIDVDDRAMQGKRSIAWALTIVGLVLPTAVTYVYFTALADAPAWTQQTAFSVGKTIQFGLPILSFLLLGRLFRVAAPQVRRSLIWGAISGLVIATAIYASYRGLLAPLGITASVGVEVKAKLQATGIDNLMMFLVVACGYAVLHSGIEEYYWRWFIYGNLRTLVGVGPAMAISSIGFMAHHVLVLARYFHWDSPWTYLASASVALGGLIWAYLYEKTGSLTGNWLSHAAVDAMIFYIGYELAFA